MGIFEAIVLGVVEGLSEFLPVSSTGHLILASALLKLQQSEAHKVFEVVIQLGAMLAVVEVYRKQLLARPDLIKKVCFAFLPTGTIGFLLYKLVKSFFQPSLVSYMLIAGGAAFIVIELWMKDRPATTHTLDEISYKQAFSIGLVQCLSMVPGVSRSGATIMGGLLFGLDRKDATEFSFLLALPTMFAATCYDVYKNYTVFHAADWQNIAVGFVTSFIFGVIGIKALLKFVTSHTFIPFGIYRIIVGVLFLVFLF
ncbi:undecaprenyl-diphosphate phosphatase [Geomonas azotofigens]|uniref:undecaprenyl-diphosphate phosphatase n=1 Tax=Geomonas azotofigens TaxID=2843196 RepID=UPI001C10A9AD|nr:undecaprenyl-diphosphate phosphatase [Geomonas azotofigens]MBU5612533.1 undecaprenyl-diphosphate phosphatase [Geomonas azotofigens]